MSSSILPENSLAMSLSLLVRLTARRTYRSSVAAAASNCGAEPI